MSSIKFAEGNAYFFAHIHAWWCQDLLDINFAPRTWCISATETCCPACLFLSVVVNTMVSHWFQPGTCTCPLPRISEAGVVCELGCPHFVWKGCCSPCLASWGPGLSLASWGLSLEAFPVAGMSGVYKSLQNDAT